jgi:hypothetical protein
MKKTVFITLSVFLFSFELFAQNSKDTTINTIKFQIRSRFSNGKIKSVGQFGKDCSFTITRHGSFLYFDRQGNIKKTEEFRDGNRINYKVMGLKHGWWGWYGKTTKYFFGIKRFSVMSDPCF